MLKPQQTQRIYAMGARLGLVESGNKNDLLHELVYSIAQKSSVRELDEQEYKKVVAELVNKLRIANLTEPKTVHPSKQKSVKINVLVRCQTVRHARYGSLCIALKNLIKNHQVQNLVTAYVV